MKEAQKKAPELSPIGVSPKTHLNLTVNRILMSPDTPPKPGHKFLWTRVGTEVMLEVGHFDLVELKRAVDEATDSESKSSNSPVSLYITDRFFLNLANAVELSKAVNSMLKDLKTSVLGSGITEEAWKAQGIE